MFDFSTQCSSFKKTASLLIDGLERALPDVNIVVNPDKVVGQLIFFSLQLESVVMKLVFYIKLDCLIFIWPVNEIKTINIDLP